MKKIIIFTVLIFSIAVFGVFADEIGEYYEQSGAEGLEIYTAPAKEFDYGFSFTETVKSIISGNISFEPEELLKKILKLLLNEIYNNISAITGIAAAVFCLGLLSCSGYGKNLDITFYICCIVVFSIGYKAVSEILNTGLEAMEAMRIFMAASVPVLGSLMASSGGVSKCMLVSGAIVGITGIVDIFIKVMMPICNCSLMLCSVNCISDEFSLSGLESGLLKFVMWSIGIIMVIFTGFLSIFAIASSCVDNVIGKTAKFMAGNFIPVVGGVVSDTLDSIITYARLIKGAVGAGGVVAVLYMCLVPAIKISAVLILYNLTAVVLSPVADRRIMRLIGGFTASLKIALALVVSSSIMFIICTGMIAAM